MTSHSQEHPGRLLLGKVTDTDSAGNAIGEDFLVEAQPPLTRKEAIDVTQTIETWRPHLSVNQGSDLRQLLNTYPFGDLGAPLFDYDSRHLLSRPNSTLIRFEQVTGDLASRLRYARRLETFLGRHLLSREVPEIQPDESLFAQRERIVREAQETAPYVGFGRRRQNTLQKLATGAFTALKMSAVYAYPSLRRSIEENRRQTLDDINTFNEQLRISAGEVSDPYTADRAAVVVKTLGSGAVAIAELFHRDRLEIIFGFAHGKAGRDFRQGSGVVRPDGRLSSFVGGFDNYKGMVLRKGDGPKADVLAVFQGPDESLFERVQEHYGDSPLAATG